jgi:hypothetical protein
VLVEVLDEGVDHLIGDERLARAVGGGLVPIHGEHAAQLVVSVRHAIRNLEAVLPTLSKDCLFLLTEGTALLALQLGDGVVGLALPLVAKSLIEHQ